MLHSLPPLTGATLVALLALATSTSAVTLETQTFVCPVDGEPFEAEVVSEATREGQMLDFKPTGDLIAPPPLAECPASRFVLYQLEFSPEEIERIRAFVNSDGYRAMTEVHTQYYRVARSYEFEQRDPWQIGFAYLQATWEVDDDPSRYREYAARAIQSFEQYVLVEDPGLPQVMWSFLLIAELKRRTADFIGARFALDAVKHHEASKSPTVNRIFLQQYELLDAKDDRPAAIE